MNSEASTTILKELETFDSLCSQAKSSLDCSSPISDSIFLNFNKSSDKIDLFLSCLIHGNEVEGLSSINVVFEELVRAQKKPNINILILVGNRPAGIKGVRFIGRDLNRSFNSTPPATWEEERAQEITGLLSSTKYLIDIHQTIIPTLNPFFIYNFTPGNFAFSRAIDSKLPIATFKGQSISTDGQGFSSTINSYDGLSFSIELGHKGFSASQRRFAVDILKKAIDFVESNEPLPKMNKDNSGDIYTWGFILKNNGEKLVDNLVNFSEVKKGDVIAYTKSREPVLAPITGRALFPKYGEYADASSELLIILTPFDFEKD